MQLVVVTKKLTKNMLQVNKHLPRKKK